jgi:hypothetical protein
MGAAGTTLFLFFLFWLCKRTAALEDPLQKELQLPARGNHRKGGVNSFHAICYAQGMLDVPKPPRCATSSRRDGEPAEDAHRRQSAVWDEPSMEVFLTPTGVPAHV